MRKIYLFALLVLTTVAVSCNNKTAVDIVIENAPNQLKSFEAQAPSGSKTSIDDHTMIWSAGDKITVVGYTEGQEVATSTFTIKAGTEGTSSATFEGSIADYDTYYAVYPSGLDLVFTNISTGVIQLPNLDYSNQQVSSSEKYDPDYGIMLASYDSESNKLSFMHGVTYAKVIIPEDGITAVGISFANNMGFSNPKYTIGESSLSLTGSGTSVTLKTTKTSGSFSEGDSCFLPFIPRSGQSTGVVTITLWKGENSKNASTNSFNDSKFRPSIGNIWNFGEPPISFAPYITPESSGLFGITYDATGGTIDYTISNPVEGGVLTAALDGEQTNTITGLSFSNPGSSSSLSFSCNARTAGDADAENDREAHVILTYTYETSKTVTANVTITQQAYGAESLTITAADVNIGAAATSGSIAYTLDDSHLVSCTIVEDNIGSLAIGTITTTSVAFTCNANTTSFNKSSSNKLYTPVAARTATVRLSYAGSEDKVITITQAKSDLDAITATTTWSSAQFSLLNGTSLLSSQGNVVISDNLLYNGDHITIADGKISLTKGDKNQGNNGRGQIRFKVSGNGNLRIVGSGGNRGSMVLNYYKNSVETATSIGDVPKNNDFDINQDITASDGDIISFGLNNDGPCTITSITWTPAS